MENVQSGKIIVGLDIGTYKVVALIGEIKAESKIEIIGTGLYPSRGLKKGVVVNIESTLHSIKSAINEAQKMAGYRITSALIGISGNHISSYNSNGIVAIRDRAVSVNDIERVLDAAQAVAIPADKRLLHTLPQDYIIDNKEGVRDPLGMAGVRLESRVHIVTCGINAYQNIEKCVHRCGLDVESVILEQLASSYAVLTEDEKELGVYLVDIGGGTTDIAIFKEGFIRHSSVIPIAGDQVTNDIAIALRTPRKYAEELKNRYACASAKFASASEIIKVPSIGDRQSVEVSKQNIAEIIEPRYEELLHLIKSELKYSGYANCISSGLVLTGGTSTMEGAVELAEEIFNMPVRLGIPNSGLLDVVRNPIYSTGVGLILYGLNKQIKKYDNTIMPFNSFNTYKHNILKRITDWFKLNF